MGGIKEVAKKAGVSIATVSNVINGTKYVSPELKSRVELAVRELDYQADPVARRLKSNNTGIIGVITGDMYGIFYSYVVEGISQIASKKDYQLILSDVNRVLYIPDASERELELFRQFAKSRVDGIIFASVVNNEKMESYIPRVRAEVNRFKYTPIVSIERDLTMYGVPSVSFNGYENSKKAVQHLVDAGCKKICFVAGPDFASISNERLNGYLDVLKENNLESDPSRMISKGDYSHQGGYRAMKELLDNVPDVDGVFCANDQSAIGALKVLKEYKKNIPEEIKIIGYDDIFVSSIIEPSLSTIHIRKRHAGKEAAKILFQLIDQGECADYKAQNVQLAGRLVVRKSTSKNVSEDWILTDW